MTKEQLEAAAEDANIGDSKAVLEDEMLFKRITQEELGKNIVGETESIQTIFLNACGIWVANAAIASYNLCIDSESGAGKDYITKSVLDMFSPDTVHSRTRISPTVFNYWHNNRFEPEWTWDGKICHLLDVSDAILNSEVFKLMCSDGSKVTLTMKLKSGNQAVDIEIRGKPVMIITTASAVPKAEMLRRFPILQLDETPEQTAKILKSQSLTAISGEPPENVSEEIKRALTFLQRVKVKIPYADLLNQYFGNTHIILRTHYRRFLDLIKASAALHQFQREKDKGYIVATFQDFEYAKIALRKTTSNPFMIPLTKNQKRLLKTCKETQKLDTWYSVTELSKYITFLNEKSLYSNMEQLENYGFFKVDIREPEGRGKPARIYSLVDFASFELPSGEELILPALDEKEAKK